MAFSSGCPRSVYVILFSLLFPIASGFSLGQSVSLRWDGNTETNLAGYNLYRSTTSGSGYTKVNGSLIGATGYTDPTIDYDVRYHYVCTAVNSSGLESGYSNEVSFTMPAPTAPPVPNNPPVAVDDTAHSPQGQPVNVNVTANDWDPDGDPLTVTAVTQPANGTTTIQSASTVRYRPNSGFRGTDSFHYTISDGRGGTATALVLVGVREAVNQAPVANAVSATTEQDRAVTIDVTANDTDPDGDPLTVTAVTQPSQGTAAVASASSVRYTPNAGFHGTDAFDYTISDGRGGTASATVTVTVTQAANRPPVANAVSATTGQDQTVTINVTANDTDPDGDPLTVTAVTQPSQGTAAVASASSVRYTPNAGFHGTDAFDYTISDGRGGTASATVTVTVTQAANRPPVANAVSATTEQDRAVTIDVTANDTDPDGDPLTVTGVTQPSQGTAAVASASSVRYTPNAGFHGTDAFDYSVTDGTHVAQARVTVDVVEAGSSDAGLVFPVTVDTGASYLANTFVGIGLVNPNATYEVIAVESLDASGSYLGETRLAEPLPPLGQTAFLGTDLAGAVGAPIALSVEGESGPVQGLFLVGDYVARRMDGVGNLMEPANRFHLLGLRHGRQESSLIHVFNRSLNRDARATLELRSPGGGLIADVRAVMLPSGSFMGTLSEIFGLTGDIGESFVTVTADTPVSGYFVHGNKDALVSGGGLLPEAAGRLMAPHFFRDGRGGDTVIRVINPEGPTVQGTVRIYADGGGVMAQMAVTLPAGRVTVITADQILGSPKLKPFEMIAGSLELEVANPDGAKLAGTITYFGTNRRAATTAPLLTDGVLEVVFPHVIQTEDNSMFTGLALFNPTTSPVRARVEAFNEAGHLVGAREINLAPRTRISDLLRSGSLLGANFAQVNGHLRVRANGAVAGFAIFGDGKGDFLAMVEGQPPVGGQ